MFFKKLTHWEQRFCSCCCSCYELNDEKCQVSRATELIQICLSLDPCRAFILWIYMTSTSHRRVQVLIPQQTNTSGFCWANTAASFRTLLPSLMRSRISDPVASSTSNYPGYSIFWFFNRQVSVQVSLPPGFSNFWQVKPLMSTKDSFETEGNTDRWGCETDYLGAAESNITVNLIVIVKERTRWQTAEEGGCTNDGIYPILNNIPHIYVTCMLSSLIIFKYDHDA